MNTKQIVSDLAGKQQLSKAETRRLLDTFVEQMNRQLVIDGTVKLSGFGTFKTGLIEDETKAQEVHFLPLQSSSAGNKTAKDEASTPSLEPFIATQSERSETFMREFRNDFVSSVQKALDDAGKVNIAGWGKFEVQTEEETDKKQPEINFTPYKKLRKQLAAQSGKVSSKKDQSPPQSKKASGTFKEEQQETSSNVTKGTTGKAAKWLSAGVAFLAGTVGAWFFFKDDD